MRAYKHSQNKKLFREYKKNFPVKHEIKFLLQSFDSAVNVGAMFRLADAVGAKELFLTGKTPIPPNEEIEITSMGQENRVPWRHVERAEEALKSIKEEGYQVVSLETAEGSVLYTDYDYPDKICFVCGNETDGVFSSVLSLSDGIVYVPMYGRNYSLNVHVSAAVVSFNLRRL